MDSSLTIDINIKECSVSCSLFDYWRIVDNIRNLKVTLNSGKIYGIIGEFGYGGWALSYILAGKVKLFENGTNLIKVNDSIVNQKTLQNIACYFGEGITEAPYKPKTSYPNTLTRMIFGIKTVAQRIQEGIKLSGCNYSLQEISNMFELSGLEEINERNGRIHRPLEFQSNEVWRASMAIGFAYGKRLFCCPWMHGNEISNYIIGDYNRKFIQILKEHNAIVLIPVNEKERMKNIANEFIHL